jgi:CheY-like chemotaxis protein
MGPFRLSFWLPAAGGLLLGAVCATRYAWRRRPSFLFWGLAWLSFSVGLLPGALGVNGPELAPAHPAWRPWAQAAAAVCGWWHPLLWACGMLAFARPARPEAAWKLLGGAVLPVTAVALVGARELPWWGRGALLAGALALVYAGSAAVFARAYRRRAGFGSLFLAFGMGAGALEQAHYALALVYAGVAGPLPLSLGYAGLLDFVLQTFAVAGLVLVLHAEERAVGPPGPGGGGTASGAPPYRILVVDDSADTAEGLALLLRLKGHTVRTAYSGAAALEAARELRPEVAVLDIGLPDLDGYEVARRLRQQAGEGARLLLVALSGLGQEADRRRSHEAGLDHHLLKPIELEELSALLAEFARAGDRPP